MLTVSNLSLQFGKRVLFDEVNITFNPGNCYGIIGANGAGKSTFLKILSGDLEPNSGSVNVEPGKRVSVLEQNHNIYDNHKVIDTVLIGNKKLFEVKKKMEDLYSKEDFSDEDGDLVGKLQSQYEEIGGWNAESDAATLLSNIDIQESLHNLKMEDLDGRQKVRVLLAQSLFGNPDILIMDEPTNDLDYDTIKWLEDFLANYENTVIVVSHDRHFLDSVCTHISDIDYGKINHFSGNYTFWHESSQLALRQRTQLNKKAEEKKKELQEFIARFSANVAKSKQATSRKKMIEKLNFEEIKPSSRRYPAIIFEQERIAGDQILNVENLSYKIDNHVLFQKISFNLIKADKVVLFSKDSRAIKAFYEILEGKLEADNGKFDWGITTKRAFLPSESDSYFKGNSSLIDWLREYSKSDEQREEVFIRGFISQTKFWRKMHSCND